MKNDNTETAKTAVLNVIASIISLFVGMIMIPIISRVLVPENLGIAVSFQSIRNIAATVVMLAIYAYFNKAMLDFKREKNSYIFSVTLFCIGMTAVFFLLALPFKKYILELSGFNDFLFYWMFLSVFVFAIYYLADYYCLFFNKQVLVFLIVLFSGPIAQITAVLLAAYMPTEKFVGRVIGLDIAYVLIAIIFLIWVLRLKDKTFNIKYIKQSLHFSVPVIPHIISQLILTQCDLVMINYFIGSDKTGIYSMAHTVGFLAYTVSTQIMAAWSPWVYRRLEERKYSDIKNNSKYIVFLGAYLSIGLLTLSPELVRIFLSKEYEECIYVIPPLVVAMYFQFIYVFIYDIEYYHKKTKDIAMASVCVAILNVILNVIFIPKYGYAAAGYTTAVSYLVLVIINYAVARRFQIKNIYNILNTAGIMVLVVAYAVGCMLLVEQCLIRMLMLIILSLIYIYKYMDIIHKVVNELLKKVKRESYE